MLNKREFNYFNLFDLFKFNKSVAFKENNMWNRVFFHWMMMTFVFLCDFCVIFWYGNKNEHFYNIFCGVLLLSRCRNYEGMKGGKLKKFKKKKPNA